MAVESTRTETLTHLDTADARLQKAGIDLAHLPRRRRIIALAKGSQIEQPVTGSWPRLASELPAGEVTDLVTPAAWIRALLPYASTRAETVTYAIRNGDGKTVVRVHWTAGELIKPSAAALPARVGIEVLRGYRSEAARVRKSLTRNTPLVESDQSWFDAVRGLPALRPTVTQRFGMRPDQAADFAVADALLGYLAEMDATVDGIVADIDTEYLHEFRVAVRRTRSVLKMLGDVLPAGSPSRLVRRVPLAGRHHHADPRSGRLPARHRRHGATVARARRSRLLRCVRPGAADARHRSAGPGARSASATSSWSARWRAALAEVDRRTRPATRDGRSSWPASGCTRCSASDRSGPQGITSDSPSEQVHALRKTCKEMRYLMEVFNPCATRARTRT